MPALVLETPPITEDITYRILARKLGTGSQAYLHQSATVAVGLDTTLKARVTNARALDPAIPQPADSDPRIVAYGADVAVQVDATQDGVSYRLIQGPGVGNEPEKVISEEDQVTGTLGSMSLREARRDRRGHGYPCAGDQDLPAGRRSAGPTDSACSTSCCR